MKSPGEYIADAWTGCSHGHSPHCCTPCLESAIRAAVNDALERAARIAENDLDTVSEAYAPGPYLPGQRIADAIRAIKESAP